MGKYREVVINRCYGGFSISPLAVKKLAEIKGRPCYLFESNINKPYRPISAEEALKVFMWTAFDIPNPNEELGEDNWHEMTKKQKVAHNKRYKKHQLENRNNERDDKDLVAVVKELGKLANGSHSDLAVVKIPFGVKWSIEEYDGIEWVAEQHRNWR